MRSTGGLIALCLFGFLVAPAHAEAFEIQVPAPAGDLAACMYRSLRIENPGQMRLATVGGTQEVTREAVGVGSSVFLWRAEIRPAGRRASVLSAEITRPLLGPDQFDREVRQAVRACAGA